jgi:hypothetical protein
MPRYVSNVLSKFQHDSPKHPQHNPSRYVSPVYGAKTQYATTDEPPPLTAQQCLTIQKVTGSILYYARAVDPTVLMPLNDIATEQNQGDGEDASHHESNVGFLATHPDATLRYHASTMILNIHSDASYLSVSNARSRLGGLFFLVNKSPKQETLKGRRRHQKPGCLRSRVRSWSVLSQRPKWRPAQSHTHRSDPHTHPNASAHG